MDNTASHLRYYISENQFREKIPPSDPPSLDSIVEKIRPFTDKIDPKMFHHDSFSRSSVTAVDSVFDSLSTQPPGPASNPLSKQNFLEDFNILYRETLNLKGLLKVTSEISASIELASTDAQLQSDLAAISKAVEQSENDKAIDLCVALLANISELGSYSFGEISCILNAQYMLGGLYTNRMKKDDLQMGIEIFYSYVENAKMIIASHFDGGIDVVQLGLHGLALATKNNGEFHMARLYFEKELEVLDLMQLRLQSGELVLSKRGLLPQRYFQLYSALGRTHDSLGNDATSAFFFEKAVLATSGFNFDEGSRKEKRSYVKSLCIKLKPNDFYPEEREHEFGRKPAEKEENEEEKNREESVEPNVITESEVALKAGEVFTEKETLAMKQKELDDFVDDILSLAAPSSVWQFSMASFDPLVFVKDFNDRLMEHRDAAKATSELTAFLEHYLKPYGTPARATASAL